MRREVLGVRVDDISMEEAVDRVKEMLQDRQKHYIVTPNPEFVMLAQEDSEFKQILNRADLSIPDGAGLKLAGVKNTVTGIDLMEELCQKSVDWGKTVGLLGGINQVAKKAAECLKKTNPGIKISFASSGGKWKIENGSLKVEDGSSVLTDFKCDILFVAFGMGKQERWIIKNLPQSKAKIAMGVGGAFDYISGNVLRSPLWLRQLGLEWLFRLILQPWRIKRQIKLLGYILKVLTSS